MKVGKRILCAAGAVLGVVGPMVLSATDIAFTGGEDGKGTDLATAANWAGGALPSADDTGVIDFATYTGGEKLTLSAALTLGGLRFSNVANAAKVSGEATLTLGAQGLAVSPNKNLTFDVPLATTAKQTWDLGKSNFYINKTISGTDDLVISNYYAVFHRADALGYDGVMTYRAGGARLATEYAGTGKWCKELKAYGARLQFSSGKNMNWKDIFTSRTATLYNWAARAELSSKQGGVMNFEDGDTFNCPSDAVDQSALVGMVNQRGGSVIPAALFFMDASAGSYYNLSGGSFKIRQYWMYLFNGSATPNVVFTQSGGTSYVNNSIDIGGNGGDARALAECTLSGGTMISTDMTLCSTRHASCAAISETDPYKGSCAGSLTITGGSLTTHGLFLGNQENNWDSGYRAIVDGFGLVRLMGGQLNISAADGGLRCRRVWNNNGAQTGDGACRYRYSFSGGTYRDDYDRTVGMQIDIPADPTGGMFTADFGLKSQTLQAPLWGEGTLRKVGKGVLRLTDATRFTGTLKVDEGAVEFAGGSLKPYDLAGDGAIVWSGDDVATGKDDGAEVAEWADLTGKHVAGNVLAQRPALTNVILKPLVVANAFNGHAGVKFYAKGTSVTGLMIPEGQNPLLGATNFTFAIVFKMGTTGGMEATRTDYQNAYNMGILGAHLAYGHSNFGVSIDKNGLPTFCRSTTEISQGGGGHEFASAITPCSVFGGSVQVLVGSSDGRTLTQTLNNLGYEGTKAHAYLKSQQPHRLGYRGTSQTDRTNEDQPLCFGFHAYHVVHWDTDKGAPQPRCAFQGEIAEIRVYPERMMTVQERNALTAALKLKYDATATEESVRCHMAGGVPTTGGPAYAEQERVALPEGAVEWNAADVVAAEGAAVTSWTGRTGKSATQTLGRGEAAPTLVKNAIAGRPALRFEAAAKTALGLAAADSPLSSASAFTLAVVFKTRTDGVTDGAARSGRGLLSTVQGITDASDVLLAFHNAGSMYCSTGNGSGSVIFHRKPCRLNDGCAHVAVFSADLANKVMMLMTDGRKTLRKPSAMATPLPARDLTIGTIGNGLADENFDGLIAAFAIWPRALSATEMTAVTEHYAHEFRFRPLAKNAFTAAEVTDRGLGATNITVAAGAYFRVPLTEEHPFAVGAGRTFSGAGRFDGTYAFGAGTTLTTATGANMEQALLEDCTIEADYEDALVNGPKDLTGVTKLTGKVTVRVLNLPPPGKKAKTRVPLFRLSPGAFTSGGSLVLADEGRTDVVRSLEISPDGLVTLFTQKGLILFLR